VNDMDLEDKQERYEFLLSKLNIEIEKFEDLARKLLEKKQDVINSVKKIDSSDVIITLSTDTQDNVTDFVNSHLLELKNLKNYINNELEKVKKQKELLNNLKAKYGDKIKIEQTQMGNFKIKYDDETIDKTIELTNISKKLIKNLKNNLLDVNK